MPIQSYTSDAVHRHIGEIAARVVAQSGIPNDRYHFGKILLQSLKDAPDFILQIDGGTGDTETFASALKRSVQCANALRNMRLETHDVIVIMAPNHIHLTVPLYASLYLGVAVAGIDMTLGVVELGTTFSNVQPKVIFCQDKKAQDVRQSLRNINHEALIVTYDDSDEFPTLSQLLDRGHDVAVDDFKASDIDPESTIALLLATSGTSGVPKAAAVSHKNWIFSGPYIWTAYNNFPTPFKMMMTVSPVQWLTATVSFTFSAIFRFTRLHSSIPMTDEHFYELVNKYKPSFMIASPTFYLRVVKRDMCDFTCFENLLVGGSAVPDTLLEDLKKISPNTKIQGAYGLSEASGIALNNSNPRPGFLGVPLNSLQYRLINPETQEDVNKPHASGELWLKGPAVFMPSQDLVGLLSTPPPIFIGIEWWSIPPTTVAVGELVAKLRYYKNPEMTREAKTEDGWLKTGDIFYRDENWNFCFVERLKMLMKYMNHQISPVEIETVIMKHPGVLDVAVTGIPDINAGDLPVACVVRREGSDVSAQEIKDLVNGTLTDTKQLRGGVIFLDELPMTATMKVNRGRLKCLVLEMERE